MGEKKYEHIMRVFLAAVFASILNSFIGRYIIDYIKLPSFISQALFIGVLVLIFDIILKEIGM